MKNKIRMFMSYPYVLLAVILFPFLNLTEILGKIPIQVKYN